MGNWIEYKDLVWGIVIETHRSRNWGTSATLRHKLRDSLITNFSKMLLNVGDHVTYWRESTRNTGLHSASNTLLKVLLGAVLTWSWSKTITVVAEKCNCQANHLKKVQPSYTVPLWIIHTPFTRSVWLKTIKGNRGEEGQNENKPLVLRNPPFPNIVFPIALAQSGKYLSPYRT